MYATILSEVTNENKFIQSSYETKNDASASSGPRNSEQLRKISGTINENSKTHKTEEISKDSMNSRKAKELIKIIGEVSLAKKIDEVTKEYKALRRKVPQVHSGGVRYKK